MCFGSKRVVPLGAYFLYLILVIRIMLYFQFLLDSLLYFLLDISIAISIRFSNPFIFFKCLYPYTIPSSFAGLPELPDQYAHAFHRGRLKTGRTRYYFSPLLQRVPQRNPLFFRAYFPMAFPIFVYKRTFFIHRLSGLRECIVALLVSSSRAALRRLVPCPLKREPSVLQKMHANPIDRRWTQKAHL